MIEQLNTDWKEVIENLKKETWFKNLLDQVSLLYKKQVVYPEKENVFRCFNYFNVNETKVVILGQDPYYNPNQANGLAFSLFPGSKITKSLENIFKELESDLGYQRNNVDLTDWAKQGVLLLNTVLTVEAHKPLSHRYLKWNMFTDYIISYINKHVNHVVFILWGNEAKQKIPMINQNKHTILSSSHPSPLSDHVSFFNSHIFSRINYDLSIHNLKEIIW